MHHDLGGTSDQQSCCNVVSLRPLCPSQTCCFPPCFVVQACFMCDIKKVWINQFLLHVCWLQLGHAYHLVVFWPQLLQLCLMSYSLWWLRCFVFTGLLLTFCFRLVCFETDCLQLCKLWVKALYAVYTLAQLLGTSMRSFSIL